MTGFRVINSITVLKTATYTLAASIFEEISSDIFSSVENQGLLTAVVVALVCLAVEVMFELLGLVWSFMQRWFQKKVLQNQINELRQFQRTLAPTSDNFSETDVEMKRLQRDMTALIIRRNE